MDYTNQKGLNKCAKLYIWKLQKHMTHTKSNFCPYHFLNHQSQYSLFISSILYENAHHSRVTFFKRILLSFFASIALDGLISIMLQEAANYGCEAFAGCPHQGCPAPFILQVHIGILTQKQLDNLLVTLLCSYCQ